MPSKKWDVETVQVCAGDEGHKHDLAVAAVMLVDTERTLHNIVNAVGEVPILKMQFIAMPTKTDEVVQIKKAVTSSSRGKEAEHERNIKQPKQVVDRMKTHVGTSTYGKRAQFEGTSRGTPSDAKEVHPCKFEESPEFQLQTWRDDMNLIAENRKSNHRSEEGQRSQDNG